MGITLRHKANKEHFIDIVVFDAIRHLLIEVAGLPRALVLDIHSYRLESYSGIRLAHLAQYLFFPRRLPSNGQNLMGRLLTVSVIYYYIQIQHSP
jgi:hypothetical protein